MDVPLRLFLRLSFPIIVAVPALAGGLATSGFAGDSAEVDFSRDIRPILSDRCFECHGFDDAAREADLGLHTFAEATRDLGGYKAVKPGDPGHSEILERITAEDPDDRMPPPEANKSEFTEEEIELIRRWIESGAEYETHWAFRKPEKPALPEGEESGKHPVDQFVDARLAERDLPVNDRADPHTLIRRLSYDLIGLPPTVEQMERFVVEWRDDPEAAWDAAITRLLDSPDYGERWARNWLDLARYADTNGYEKDRPRSIWPYRDWVVEALEDDMPYDRFTIEQLAGDMLPDPTTDQLVATGFHRNTMLNEEGGIDPLEYRYHAMVDRVATTGTVWMGLTTGCAQCHTHKFDPITHTDYFSLMALMNNADEVSIPVPSPELEKRRAAIEKRIAQREEKAFARIDEAAYEKWVARRREAAVDWTPLEPASLDSNLPYLQVEDDRSIYASGDFTKRDVYEIGLEPGGNVDGPITALRLEVLPDERLPGGGPGAAYYEGRKGDFFLSEVDLAADGEPVEVADASVSFGEISIGRGSATGPNTIDDEGSTGWSTAGREGERNELVLNLAEPLRDVEKLDVELLFERHFVAALGRFRLSVTTEIGDVAANESGIPHPDRVDDEEMRRHYIRHGPKFEKARKRLAALREKMPEYPTTLVFDERPPENPRTTHRHHRGEYLSPKEVVEPAVPALFDPIPEDQPANRLGFARWLVSERNPLAARVAVNRAWRSFFGHGNRAHLRRLRLPGRAAHPPRAARLARRDLRGERVVHERPAPPHRHQRGLPPRQHRPLRAAGERSREPLARPRTALPAARRDDPRRRPGGLRPALRQSGRPRGAPPAARQRHRAGLRQRRVAHLRGRGSPPPQPLHLREAHRALRRLPDLRRAHRRELRGPPRPQQHPAAGPHPDERRHVHRGRRGPRPRNRVE